MTKAKFVVVGSGAREHCLVEILQERGEVFSFGGSDKIREVATPLDKSSPHPLNEPLSEEGLQAILSEPDSVILFASEEPLVLGWVDQIREKSPKQAILGPSKAVARLEGSKLFAKEFLTKYKIPTPRYRYAQTMEEVSQLLSTFQAPYVIKADGLARGKGVGIFSDADQALNFAQDILVRKAFGEQKGCLVEEFQEGKELSLFLLLDGKSALQIGIVRDHKRLLDGDQGPNTGGMGAFLPPPDLLPEDEMAIYRNIVRPLMKGLVAEGLMYRGFMYLGLIKTREGFQVLEINVRLGDPESQALLPLIRGRFSDFCLKAAEGVLATVSGEENVLQMDSHLWWYQPEGSAVTVVLTTPGYPSEPQEGIPLPGLEEAQRQMPDYIYIFHGNTRREGDRWVTGKGRVLSITAVHPDLAVARQKCYEAISDLGFTSLQYRQDIAQVPTAKRATTRMRQRAVVVYLSNLPSARNDLLWGQEVLKKFQIPAEVQIVSPYATFSELEELVDSLRKKNLAALLFYGRDTYFPKVLTYQTTLPLIWVSSETCTPPLPQGPYAFLGEGRDGLYAAGLFIASLLAVQYPSIGEKLRQYYQDLKRQIDNHNREEGSEATS